MTYIVVGRFGKAHGVRGAVTIQSFTDPATNILQYHPWYVKTKKGWEEIKIDSLEQRGKQLIAWVNQINDREQASALTNQDIAVARSVLPELPDGEYYWDQIIGLQVVNLNQVCLGKVTDLISTGANDVIVVEGERKYMIPFLLEHYIQSIDLVSGKMIVDWDETF